MGKHTPGPWHLQVEVDGSGTQFVGVFTEAIEKAPGDFQWVLRPDTKLDPADGALFAAAPELLDAAKSLVEQCLNPNFDNEETWRRKIEKMEKAIAKAENGND